MTLALIWFSPKVQVDLRNRTEALFPYRNPGLFTLPLSFLVGIAVSLARPEAVAGFAKLERQIHLGK